MNMSTTEREVLESFSDGDMMTLKMVAAKIRKKSQNMSKQSVWYALQLLVARNISEKVDRGVYRKV